jgi:hypothetical protein
LSSEVQQRRDVQHVLKISGRDGVGIITLRSWALILLAAYVRLSDKMIGVRDGCTANTIES